MECFCSSADLFSFSSRIFLGVVISLSSHHEGCSFAWYSNITFPTSENLKGEIATPSKKRRDRDGRKERHCSELPPRKDKRGARSPPQSLLTMTEKKDTLTFVFFPSLERSSSYFLSRPSRARERKRVKSEEKKKEMRLQGGTPPSHIIML